MHQNHKYPSDPLGNEPAKFGCMNFFFYIVDYSKLEQKKNYYYARIFYFKLMMH